MPILLIGYRGSGKTSVGKNLASVLGCSFADSDDQIVKTAGMTIKEIFEREGEPGFRDRETAVLRELLKSETGVLSLGGGAVLREENRKLIRDSNCPCIYLSSTPEELFKRIHGDPQTAKNRPALTNLGGGIDEIKSLREKRDPIYRQVATAIIDVTNLTVDQIVEQIRIDILKSE